MYFFFFKILSFVKIDAMLKVSILIDSFSQYDLSLYFYWHIVDLQCSANLCCMAKWLRYTNIYVLFHICFQYGLSQDIEYSSLSYTLGPCCLSILNVIVCNYQPQTPSPFLFLPHSSLTTTSLFSLLKQCSSSDYCYGIMFSLLHPCKCIHRRRNNQ